MTNEKESGHFSEPEGLNERTKPKAHPLTGVVRRCLEPSSAEPWSPPCKRPKHDIDLMKTMAYYGSSEDLSPPQKTSWEAQDFVALNFLGNVRLEENVCFEPFSLDQLTSFATVKKEETIHESRPFYQKLELSECTLIDSSFESSDNFLGGDFVGSELTDIEADYYYSMERVFEEHSSRKSHSSTESSNEGSPTRPTSPSHPSASLLLGTKDAVFICSYLRWYSLHEPLFVDLDLLKKAVGELMPSNNTTLRKRTSHYTLVACIALGALIENFVEEVYFSDCSCIIMQCDLIEAKQSISNYESLFALYSIGILFYLTNNKEGFHRIISLIPSLDAPKKSSQRRRRRLYYQLVGLEALTSSTKYEQLKPALWRQILCKKSLITVGDFPHLSKKAHKFLEEISASEQCLEDVLLDELQENSVNFYLRCLADITMAWALEEVLPSDEFFSAQKIEVLEEVVRFLEKLTKYHSKQKLSPEVTASFEILQIFVMVMSGEHMEAKILLRKVLKDFLETSILLNHFMTQFSQCTFRVHQLHFVAMALSILEMFPEYELLQKKVKTMSVLLKIESNAIPEHPPIQGDNVCTSSSCQAAWNHLSCSKDIPSYSMPHFLEILRLLI